VSHIKSALEIALERSKQINKLSPQELSEIKQKEKIDSILAKYYKEQIESDDLWKILKGFSNKLLTKAQNNFIQSLTFQSNDYEIEKRKKELNDEILKRNQVLLDLKNRLADEGVIINGEEFQQMDLYNFP